jgi:hemophore-related protein
MQIYTNNTRRRGFGVFAATALGGLAAATIALPTASAQPPCTAAGLTDTLGSVATATGQYLASHPDADEAVTNAGALSSQDADAAIRTYFVAHPQQWGELQSIARPLAGLRQHCQTNVAPASIARLFDAMAA